ncbi:hypothetical protein OPV22_011395 [Ensete ventricosum]|uniref:ENTH domain-containing protein n=1 Tax=Ensete ventricosum TaxID=4639 RepID=A0AAV8R9K5_ENSVE|nr:hypothetical protein OPV22_011395 [Ensete ventricosum]
MGTLESWRKAYGALKDTTTVRLAKVNSEFKDLDIAVVKATNHVECPPKERHIRSESLGFRSLSLRFNLLLSSADPYSEFLG